MPMAADDIADMIRAAIPDAQVDITDLPATATIMPSASWRKAFGA